MHIFIVCLQEHKERLSLDNEIETDKRRLQQQNNQALSRLNKDFDQRKQKLKQEQEEEVRQLSEQQKN